MVSEPRMGQSANKNKTGVSSPLLIQQQGQPTRRTETERRQNGDGTGDGEVVVAPGWSRGTCTIQHGVTSVAGQYRFEIVQW